jgi:hypothetical protein
MPIFGKQDVQAAVARAAQMTGFDTEPWELKNAEILQVSYEIVEGPAEELIPPALHPSIPPYVTLSVARFPESPAGPFSLAQVRIVVRAGIRPRGHVLRAYTDSEKASSELRRRWGFPVDVGEITLRRRHDRINGQVVLSGQTILEIELENPEAISGSDISYIDNLHLARVREGEKESPILVQVDPEYVFHQAERGRPRLMAFRGNAWGAEEQLHCTSPITATFTRCDTDFPKIRFVMDPSVPTFQGTRKVN